MYQSEKKPVPNNSLLKKPQPTNQEVDWFSPQPQNGNQSLSVQNPLKNPLNSENLGKFSVEQEQTDTQQEDLEKIASIPGFVQPKLIVRNQTPSENSHFISSRSLTVNPPEIQPRSPGFPSRNLTVSREGGREFNPTYHLQSKLSVGDVTPINPVFTHQTIKDQQIQPKSLVEPKTKNNKTAKISFLNNVLTIPNLQLKENPQEKETEKKDNKPQNQPSAAPPISDNKPQAKNTTPAPPEAKTNPQEEQPQTIPENQSKQASSGNATGGGKGGNAPNNSAGLKAPNSPETDPAFQEVVKQAGNIATEKKEHDPAEVESKKAQDAAESPEAELKGKAQDQQVGEMEAQPPGTFNAAAFKAQILEKIQAITPTTEKEAQEFKDNNKINQVKNDVSSQVSEEKKNAANPIENKVKEEPDPSKIEPKPVTPLPEPKPGEKPADIGSQKAAPKAKTESEVSAPLQQNSQKIDQKMAECEITDEQLAKSNEPQFLGALEAKKEVKNNAQTAPGEYRQAEKGILNKAEGESQQLTQTGLEGMHSEKENILTQVMGKQEETKGKDEEKRAEIGNHINGIYEQTKTDVEKCLSDLDGQVNSKFDTAANNAQKAFEDYVDQKMKAYKKERYGSGLDALSLDKLGNRFTDTFTGLPPEVNQFFVDGRQLYINEMDIALTEISQLVADRLNEAKQKITEGKQKIQDYVTSLPENLQQIGKEAADNIQSKFDELEQSVDNKQKELVDSLVGKYQENLQAVDAKIEEMKEQNKGLLDKAKDAIQGTWETIKNLKEMLMGALASAADVVSQIIQDPIGFLGNLISGVKQGFDNFLANIMTHLQGGLIAWLTGAMGSMGLQIPDNLFSFQGIFSLVTQILGLSWNYVRSKAVKMFSEPVVAAMEKGSEIFQLLQTGGLAGVWEYVQDQFTDLKETIIDEIKNMVITQVITAGVKWVLSLLNPASAFVKAAMMIYDIVMFFINRGSQIIDLVKAVTESLSAIASGAVGQVAQAIENALVKSLPVVIGFMASLLGIGDLVGKVQKIIGKIRKRIDQAIDKLLEKAKKLFKKVVKTGKATVKQVGKAAKGAFNKLFGIKTKFTTKTGESHSIYYQEQDGKPVLMVASNPQSIRDFLAFYQNEYKIPKEKIQPIYNFITQNIDPLIGKLNKAKTEADKNQIQQELLEQNVTLSEKLKTLMSGNDQVGEIIDSYLLEGLTGTYSSMPKAKKDLLTADHQPQAAILVWSAKQPFFGKTSNMATRADGRASQGYAVNLYETRHKEGRTFGSKGETTKQQFIATVQKQLKGVTTNQEKRNITVDLIKEELGKDVKTMNNIAKKSNKDSVWSDIHALEISQPEKDKLINTIRSNILQGEQQILSQDLESLKN